MSFWNVEERQGDYKDAIYVTVPEYQPSQASITLGAPQLYKPSQKAENIRVGMGLDATTIVLIAVPVGLLLIWLWRRRK